MLAFVIQLLFNKPVKHQSGITDHKMGSDSGRKSVIYRSSVKIGLHDSEIFLNFVSLVINSEYFQNFTLYRVVFGVYHFNVGGNGIETIIFFFCSNAFCVYFIDIIQFLSP